MERNLGWEAVASASPSTQLGVILSLLAVSLSNGRAGGNNLATFVI